MSADEERGKLLAAVASIQLNDRRQDEALERIEVRLDALSDDMRQAMVKGLALGVRRATPLLAASSGGILAVVEGFRLFVLPLLTGHH